MTPLDATLANNLRVKLGKGRELPEEPKPKRVPRPKVASAEGDAPVKTPRARKKTDGAEEGAAAVELRPAATIVKPKPVSATPEILPESPEELRPAAAEVVTEPKPAAPPPLEEEGLGAGPKPAVTPGSPSLPQTKKPEPKIVPFRPLERPTPPRPSRHPAGPFAPPPLTVGPPHP